jgi:hypothetical protein
MQSSFSPQPQAIQLFTTTTNFSPVQYQQLFTRHFSLCKFHQQQIFTPATQQAANLNTTDIHHHS